MRRWWLALALFGCDGIGDPVVGMTPPDRGRPPFMCEQAELDCTQRFMSRAPFEPPALVTPESACPGGAAMQICADARASGCVLALRGVEDVPVVLPALSCVVLDLTPAPGSERVELRELSVTSSRIALHASTPTEFVLAAVDLTGVAIELTGPISLRIDGSLNSVSIASDEPVEVDLRDGRAESLRTRLPAGSLRIQRSTIRMNQLHARSIELNTLAFSDLSVRAEQLIATLLDGDRVQLDVGDVTLSEFAASGLELHRCDSALFVDARLTRPLLSACSDRLRTHFSSLSGGRAQGLIESVRSYWGTMHFGAAASTTVDMWEGTVTSSVFCPALERLALSQLTAATCNNCLSLPNPELHLCIAAAQAFEPAGDAGVLLGGNEFCPVIDEGLPPCDPSPRSSSPL